MVVREPAALTPNPGTNIASIFAMGRYVHDHLPHGVPETVVVGHRNEWDRSLSPKTRTNGPIRLKMMADTTGRTASVERTRREEPG